jgi:outer membrane protein assembly factor BamB
VIVADGKVYGQIGDVEYRDPETGMRGRDLYVCLNATTGELIWELPYGVASPSGNHCIAYGNLYAQFATTEETASAGVFSRRAIGDTLYCVSDTGRDWTMFRGDPTHQADGDAGPTNLALKWKYKTGGTIISSPSIADGIVYVGSIDKKIYANDAEDGSLIWSFETGYKVYSSPAVVNGKVYTGADDGTVYCLDAKDGDVIWANNEPGDIDWINHGALQSFTIRSSPTVIDGKVYVGSLDKILYVIDANTGITLWTFDTGGYIYSSPAVADGAVYVASSNGRPAGRLYKLNANNGSVLWSKMLFYQRGPGPLVPWASPVVADGMVFQSIDGFNHYGINATTGATVWTYRSINWVVIAASPLYADHKVYLVDMFGLVAVDSKTGASNLTDPDLLWVQFLGREIYSSPTHSSGKIYVASQMMALYVLDAFTGEKLSFAEMGALPTSSPSIYDGKVYIGGWDGNIFCYEEAPPVIITPPTPPPTWPSADEIATTVINSLPMNPSANDIANEILNRLPAYPEGPTADEVAQATVNKLPAYPQAPSAAEVSQAVINQMPEYPQPTVVPEYSTMDIVILVAVAIAIVIGLVSLFRKQK